MEKAESVKSTTVSNVAAALAETGLKGSSDWMRPKGRFNDSAFRHGEAVPTVLQMYQEKKQNLKLEDIVQTGYQGIVCVEAGGPTPGLGCAGRGIITALEKLEETGHMRYASRMLCFMMCSETLYAVDFLCRCEMDMRTRSLLLLLEKIWRFMQVRILLWR